MRHRAPTPHRKSPRFRARKQPHPPRRRAATQCARDAAPSRRRRRPAPSCCDPGGGRPAARHAPRGPGRSDAIVQGPKRTGPCSRLDSVVLADGTNAGAEVGLLRAVRAREQLVERALERARQTGRLVGRCEREQVLARPGVELLEQRQDPSPDQAALRVAIRAVLAVCETRRGAVRLGLLTPEAEQRSHDAVLALRLDAGAGTAARDEPVEDGLDLVRGSVAGRAEPVRRVARTGARAARPRCGRAARRRPRRPARRDRSARPRPTPRRGARGSRAAPTRGSRAPGERPRGRSSPRRRRRGRSPRRRVGSARAGGCPARLARAGPGRPSRPLSPGARHVPGTELSVTDERPRPEPELQP